MLDILKKTETSTCKMFEENQLIYELKLASLELDTLLDGDEISDKKELLKKRVAYFESIDNEYTDYYYITERGTNINHYLTHYIYPYKGKFHPQLVRSFINIINAKEGDIILDPFIGSGTTALECQLLGIKCIGIDISPLCILVSNIKTNAVFYLDKIKDFIYKNNIHDKNFIDNINKEIEDKEISDFFKLIKIKTLSDVSNRNKEFYLMYNKNIDFYINAISELSKYIKSDEQRQEFILGDATDMYYIQDESVDGVITSPPYSIALNYIKNDIHALDYLGEDAKALKEKMIGIKGSGKARIEKYNEDIQKTLSEIYRVLKPNKYTIIVIGNPRYNGKVVECDKMLLYSAEKIGFKVEHNIKKIIYGEYNRMNKENIIILSKK